jgi:glycogen operon protein
MTMHIRPGKPYPLGATYDGAGVNFALFSDNAIAVELCLFDTSGDRSERERIRLPEQTDNVWHVYVPGLRPGQLYGYRVSGPYAPEAGHRFNPAKLLADPYAQALSGEIKWDDSLFGYPIGHPAADLRRDDRDSAAYMSKCVVVDPEFDWGADRHPGTPLHKSVIYELHVKGFTARHPEVDERLRGTYAGLASPPAIDYLRRLGVTAVELLPVHQFVDDRNLQERGLHNYWGYNTLGFFAPHAAYAAAKGPGEQVREFKAMVKALHAAGIEVILDVVYNHTGEGTQNGPTLAFRGIDNFVYYRLAPDNRRYYLDYTGTGNTLDVAHPRTLQLIMDSLRYWVTEMHVDGFRFDLTPALVRGHQEGGAMSSFLDVVHQDPVVSQVKLIAEPWDIGAGGYQVGNFPVLWAEWNDKYRDAARRFWRGDELQVRDLAYRLTGSSDLYQHNGRHPSASINFVTAHDGFTLDDLVSYNQKHNQANGEDNRDGNDHNLSWNCGVEGPTEDPNIRNLRERQKRNFLATLFLSQGVPMLLAGDERGRTQGGNNNAYCQDNAVSWLNWQLDERDQALLQWTRRLIAIRCEHPVLHRRRFFQGQHIHGTAADDIAWFRCDGLEMSDEEWDSSSVRCLGMLLNGQAMDEWDEQGQHVRDDVMLILMNGRDDMAPFKLPAPADAPRWEVMLDTNTPEIPHGRNVTGGDTYFLPPRTLVLLRRPKEAL